MKSRLSVLSIAFLALLPLWGQGVGRGQDGGKDGAPEYLDIGELLQEVRAEGGSSTRTVTLPGTESARGNLIVLRQDVALHFHARHDETVYVLEGKGRMRLGTKEFDFSPGYLIAIPKGTHHAVQLLSDEPLVAISIFSPPFDGKDRIMVNN